MSVGMDCETESLKEGPAPYVVALYDSRGNKPSVFVSRGDESHVLEATLAMENCRDLATFNGTQFDFRMMAACLSNKADQQRLARLALTHTDIMLQFASDTGYFSSLESFAVPTLGAKKIGSGASVREQWEAGKCQEVADYCADDARLTAELYNFGRARGYLLRSPKSKPEVVKRWPLGAELWDCAYKCLQNPATASFMDDPPDVKAMGDWTLQYL